MATFRKSVKGNDNEANEEFSHNRITVNFNGAGPLVLVLFVVGLITSAIVWLVLHYGGLLLLSLLALWIVGAAGSIWLLGVWVYAKTRIMLSESRRAHNLERFLFAPEGTHSIYLQDLQPGYDVFEVSANVVAAGVPMMLPPAEEKKITADDQTIIEMWQDGVTLEGIVQALVASKVSYYRVQRVVNEAKARGIVRKG